MTCVLIGRQRHIQGGGGDCERLKAEAGVMPRIDSHYQKTEGFPGGSAGKESACNTGDPGLIPGLGRSPGEGNGNPLQYSRLKNPMDRGAWWATFQWDKESNTTKYTFF